ncbi:MAG: VWA domain-containing protein, partial [Thaumarchaeota archaeon]
GGGTKIGACLSTLLERHGHLIDRRTIVIVISDGMDTGEVELLEDQMRRLKQRSRWVVWLNPLLADPAYEPVCRGMQTALPYVDTFASANTVIELQKFSQTLRNEPALRARG